MKYKILIVDDEPLARIGLSGLVCESFPDFEIVSTAANGNEAIEILKKETLDLVITDIKMPAADGFDILTYIQNTGNKNSPLCILLSSFEEFEYARTAMKLNAFDYLVKMELNKETLEKTLNKAKKVLVERRTETGRNGQEVNLFTNRFLYHLVSGGYTSEEEILDFIKMYELDLKAEFYKPLTVDILFEKENLNTGAYSTYLNILSTVKECIGRYTKSTVIAYNHQRIACILLFHKADEIDVLTNTISEDIRQLIKIFFNTGVSIMPGKTTSSLNDIHLCFEFNKKEAPALNKTFDLNVFNKRLIESLENFNLVLFDQTVRSMESAIDALAFEELINIVSFMIHLVMNCIYDGEKILSESYKKEAKSYQVLYTYHKKSDIIRYLDIFKSAVKSAMQNQLNDPKYNLVIQAKDYIKNHIFMKISLADTASFINVSPNYLSALFRQYSDLGFSEYINKMKVKKAQELLAKSNLKIYQVSEELGFDNPQYFSRVFKKYTGHTPTDMGRCALKQEGN